MKRKGLIILPILGVVVIILAAGFIYVRIRQAWPQTQGALRLAGLHQPVTVIRDPRGIPHIYAQDSHDLFMAQGYVHAQDRFWQMEFWRRIGQGRLAEILGPSALPQDKFLRTLGIAEAARASLDEYDAESRQILVDYAEGVNAYLRLQGGRLPLEFQVLALNGVVVKPEPWKPEDTVTWGTMMSWDLGGNYDRELELAQVLSRFGEDTFQALVVSYPGSHPVVVPKGIAWERIAPPIAELPRGLVLGQGSGVGSNNWVISGKKSATGKPLLANDPHLGIQMPSIWYEVGLHCRPASEGCPYDVVGFSFPTAPGVVIGHNARIAWGVTNAGPDVQDLYVEKLNPANPNQVEVNGHWEDMQVSHQQIRVAGQKEPVSLVVRRTRHGPIINDVATGPESRWAYGWQPVALKWTALGANRVLMSVLRVDRARNWQEFREALRYWDCPAQNFVYADIEGNIGYQMPGQIPIRAKGNGMLPVPGWTDEYAWTRMIPFEELPTAYNPPEGYIATSNNKIVPDSYPYLISLEWDSGYRAQRVVELLQAQETLSVTGMAAMQYDNASLFARVVIPILQDIPLDRPEVARARDRLLRWDLQQDMECPEALLFAAFSLRLPAVLLGDELGTLAPKMDGSSMALFASIVLDPAARWWDDATTAPQESRADTLARALNEGYDLAAKLQGKDMSRWRWGKAHRAVFDNQTLGHSGISLIEGLFNRGPVQTAGGPGIVNATQWDGADPQHPFAVTWVPSMRMVVDLSNLDNSITTSTTGQSGHPYHRHYDDQIGNWRLGRYAPMYWDEGRLRREGEGVLTLSP